MEEINKYKEVWQNQKIDNQIDKDTLATMIQKKSSSVVKWIFYVSIIEFALIILVNLFIKTDWNTYRELGLYRFVKIINVLGYVITILFMYLFYRNYQKISVVQNTKQLINNILTTRKTVKYYIYINLFGLALASLYSFYVILQSDEYITLIDKFGKYGLYKVWVIVSLVLMFVLGIVWLIYNILYGYLLRKLKTNYNELTEEH